jgi:ABC-type amino acid transport substrate-binding protein
MKLKVGIVITEPYVIEEEVNINGDLKKSFSGVLYEIWTKIKELNNLDVEEISLGRDFSGAVKKLQNREFDLIVGNMWVFEDRARIIDYTRPILLNKIMIAYKPQKSKLQVYYEIIKEMYLLPLLSILVVSIILGTVLYYFEPERGRGRAIWTTIASFLGEMGMLFENTRLRIGGMIVAFTIAVVAFYYTLFLQAYATTEMVQKINQKELDEKNIKGKFFATPKGLSMGKVLAKYRMRSEDVKIAPNKMADYYLKNTDKYDGYLTTYENMKADIKKHPELVMTEDNFGYEETAFMVGKGNRQLLDLLNIGVTTLQEHNTIKDICSKYFGEADANLCVL